MIAAVWGHLWPAIVGCGVGQVITYLKLKARIAEHRLAQDRRARDMAEAVGQLRADVNARAGKIGDDLAGLAETIRAVMQHRKDTPLCVAATMRGACAPGRNWRSPEP